MARNLPDDWVTQMAAEEQRTGLPAGTLNALISQETGLQQRFLDDPAAYHYAVGPKGEKPKSSARGLGGILKGTARDPGFGVTPLKDWSVPEQLRFMADYTKARSGKNGDLRTGLAAYGEGAKYAQQVMGRINKATPVPVEQAKPIIQAEGLPPVPMSAPQYAEFTPERVDQAVAPQVQTAPVQVAQVAAETVPTMGDAWTSFTQRNQVPVQVADLAFGMGMPAPMAVPEVNFGNAVSRRVARPRSKFLA